MTSELPVVERAAAPDFPNTPVPAAFIELLANTRFPCEPSSGVLHSISLPSATAEWSQDFTRNSRGLLCNSSEQTAFLLIVALREKNYY